MKAITAKDADLAQCHDCGLLVHFPHGDGPEDHPDGACPRCYAHLHLRKPYSIQRTWALVIAAFILFLPANLVPIMRVTTLGQGESSTIMSGVMHLLHGGMWPLALVVFVASVFVPLMKMFAIVYLLISVQRNSTWRPAERTRIYRLTEILGRWSMVDIYVVTILVALVQAGALAQVEAEPGAIFFGAVVVVTMIAAESFDPRLIWDRCGEGNG